MFSKNLNNKFVDLCYSIYPKKILPALINSDEYLLEFLKKNRLDHYFSIKNKVFPKITQQYNEYQNIIIKSLKILKKSLNNKPFLIIKTFSSYHHITGDLDVVVKDKETVLKYNKLRLPIVYDINNVISWTNDEEISHDFIWNNIQKYNFHGVTIFIPNPNLDVLIRLAHLPFELAEFRLGELLHIFKQSKKVDWKILEKEACNNGWKNTFKKTKCLLDTLHTKLFETSDFVNFPYHLPYTLLAQAVIEKKAWKKIWGARYIIKDRLGL